MRRSGLFFLATLLLTACGGGLGRIGVGGVERIAVEQGRVGGFDARVGIRISNGNKKTITFESCRVELRYGGKPVAVVTLPQAVEVEPSAGQVRDIPVRVHLSRGAVEVAKQFAANDTELIEGGELQATIELVIRKEGDDKGRTGRTVRLRKRLDRETLKKLLHRP